MHGETVKFHGDQCLGLFPCRIFIGNFYYFTVWMFFLLP